MYLSLPRPQSDCRRRTFGGACGVQAVTLSYAKELSALCGSITGIADEPKSSQVGENSIHAGSSAANVSRCCFRRHRNVWLRRSRNVEFAATQSAEGGRAVQLCM